MLNSLTASVYGPFRERFHEARADLFMQTVRPVAGATLLDLGGGDGSFASRLVDRVPLEVTVAEPDVTREAARSKGFSVRQIAPGEPLPFADKEFDIVLCNSVIEHATFWAGDRDGSWSERAQRAQLRFAGEIRRVARSYFVQTPHADFPIDAHLWLPGTNWLPHRVVGALVPITDRVWLKKCGVADWRLLRARDMRRFFPDATIVVERTLGLPKSIVAVKALGH